MGCHKILYFFICIIMMPACIHKNDIYKTCEVSTENLTEEEYVKVMNTWLDCLVVERIKEKSIQKLYEDISGKHIEGAFLGFEGKLSNQYLSYKALAEVLTDNELAENLNSEDSAIKFYSFLAIAERERANVFEVLKTLLNDTTKISTQFGCVMEETTVADACIDRVTEKYYHYYEGNEPNNYQLSPLEKKKLDSIVLNSNYELKYRKYLEGILKKQLI